MGDSESGQICAFIVPKKNRRCRLAVKRGLKYCGEHAFAGDDEVAAKRVRCPLDPKHTVCADELHRHLKKCNSRLPADAWISENCNKCSVEVGETGACGWPWVDRELASKVEELFANNSHQVSTSQLAYADVEKELQRPDIAPVPRKYLVQQSSILGHLDGLGMLSTPPEGKKRIFVEFGAGRAQLTSWLAINLPAESNEFLIVDRAGTRNKYENKVLNSIDAKVSRLRCGIEHLDLSSVPAVQSASSVVAVCKHVCGAASDFSLRCVSNALSKGVKIECVVFAPCCHNKTELSQFSGAEYLLSQGFNRDEFPSLKVMASWATCGITLAKRNPNEEGSNQALPYSFTPQEKEELGKKTKFLLELSRAEFLRKCGFDTRLFYYVPYTVTPENILIVACK